MGKMKILGFLTLMFAMCLSFNWYARSTDKARTTTVNAYYTHGDAHKQVAKTLGKAYTAEEELSPVPAADFQTVHRIASVTTLGSIQPKAKVTTAKTKPITQTARISDVESKTIPTNRTGVRLDTSSLRAYLVSINVKNVDIAIKQVLIHTNNLTNIKNNNLFDMSQPKLRHTLSLGPDKYGMATFKTWQAACDDYVHWQATFKIPNNLSNGAYVNKLLSLNYKTNKALYKAQLTA